MALVEVKGARLEQAVEILPNDQTVALRLEDKNTLQLIASTDNVLKISSQNKRLSDQMTIYPAIKTIYEKSTSFITNRISVRFPDNTSKTNIDKIVQKYDLTFIKETIYGSCIFETSDASQTLKVANTIHEKENVVWSSPDFVTIITKNTDTLYPLQYYLNNTGQGGGTFNIDINAPEAWDITIGSNNIRVAVIDDGIDAHDEFTGRLLSGFTAGTNNTLGVPLNHSSKGHGVNCAGIIGAAHNNGEGIKGIAPNTLLIPVNIFPLTPTLSNQSGAASSSDIATAIHWAWHPSLGNADVLSNSWGGGIPSTDITTEINNARTAGRNGKGSIVVFASGNGGASSVSYPSSISGVIAVGAVDRNGNIWNYSNRGSQLNLVAPSGALNNTGDVVTTDRMGTWGYNSSNFSHVFGGTSAACPQVAGVAALMLSVNPNLTENQVRTTLQNTATDMGTSGFDNTFGYGRLNASGALQQIIPDINGSANLCSSGTYSLSFVPSGASVTWTVSPSHLASVSGTGATATVNVLGSGNVTLKAVISQGGGNFTIKRTISTGASIVLDGVWKESSNIGPGPQSPMNFVALYNNRCSDAIDAEWTVTPSSAIINYNSGITCPMENRTGVSIQFLSSGTYTISARVKNKCGSWTNWSSTTLVKQ